MQKHILLLGSVLMLILLFVQCVSAIWILVPNGSFESGTVGLIPDNWVMLTKESGPENATYIHEMQQTDQKYFEGSRSLWMHSRIVNTDGLKRSRNSGTIAETEDWINACSATHVRIYIRDIKSTHSPFGWGWGNGIRLMINNVSVVKAVNNWMVTHGEFINWNYYNYTALGADGESWYVYEYGIPASVDKTHMKIEIECWAGDWSFYDTSYFSDLEFVVDKVELYTPYYELTVTSSPVAGMIFTINGTAQTTPYTEWLPGCTYTLEMPETHTVGDAKYYWNQWDDGENSRSRTVTLDENISLTAYYTGPYYELVVTSSPTTGITFTIDGVPEITPHSEWLLGGSYILEMPETYDGYEWSHWFEDGDTERIKTITLPGSTWTGVYVLLPPPSECVGGEIILISKNELTPSPLTIPLIVFASVTIIATAVSVVYVEHRKKQQT